MLSVFNTLTRKKEVFRPRNEKRVDLFVCGPTVYDFSHIGHARTYVIFDVAARYLAFLGFKVNYLQNITDIDDKIIRRAQERKQDAAKIAQEFTAAYLKDIKRLGVNTVTRYAAASRHIPEIIAQIAELIEREFAYQTPTGVYFSVEQSKEYGKLSRQKIDEMREAVRIEADRTKKNPADFALWKSAKPGEPQWNSPWGPGRPGWHIEDTAISEKYFGPQYDMHGGALDLIFPHHESEIAQMEALSGKKPFVRYWLHAGFLNVRGEKMAKSLGNFITIRELLQKHRSEAFRLLVLQTHYRSPVDYNDTLATQAESALERLMDFRTRLEEKTRGNAVKTSSGGLDTAVQSARKKFFAAMDDDFDTPGAIAALFELIHAVNPSLAQGRVDASSRKTISEFLKEIHAILGIFAKQNLKAKAAQIPEEIKNLMAQRERLRKEKRFFEADAARRKLMEMGWQLEDTPQGPRLERRFHM